jgi:hypothetical protein
MAKAKERDGKATSLLEPVGTVYRTGAPTTYRVRRPAAPESTRLSRLLFLPPAWARASFWLPVGLAGTAPRGRGDDDPGPRNDFAA